MGIIVTLVVCLCCTSWIDGRRLLPFAALQYHSRRHCKTSMSAIRPATLRHAKELRDRGFTVLPSAGLDGLVPSALQACETELLRRVDDVAKLGVDPFEQGYSFEEICHRSRLRWDLRVPSPAIDKVCKAAAAHVEDIICALHKLPVRRAEGIQLWPRRLSPRKPRSIMSGSIISVPGAPAQKFHRDSRLPISWVLPSHRLFNVFVPLVNISQDDVGTQFLPGSHLMFSDKRLDLDIGEAPAWPAGGIILFDFRLLHRGLEHMGGSARPYAYAVLGTGWARDDKNFPARSLDAIIEHLPEDEFELEVARRAIRNANPYWVDLLEEGNDKSV